ncbi:hypothetical protein HA402_008039 [Bradysia odoriphaga]|nr:hypothetical protein HA402_008039 [Bradysia odoriphaga]
MPFIKPVKSLYDTCIKTVHDVIYSYSTYLEKNSIDNRSLKIADLNAFLTKTIPTQILDDILLCHQTTKNEDLTLSTTDSYYFYRAVLHGNVQKFQAKNHRLTVSYWKCLFKTSFINVRVLNLALSCNDAILKMIPKYCPNLEWLNATCKYERVNQGGNATSFTLSVTDVGLACLCNCRKLKILTINDPRSAVRGLRNSITYDGIRKLLREVKTLEDITYSDLGTVIAKNMEDVEALNINILRHFNATKASLFEIFRLCNNLQELYLVFFKYDDQQGVMDELLNSSYCLRALEVQNLNCGNSFVPFFEKIGANLVFLSISNEYEGITFADLMKIGRLCPNLKSFGCSTIDNRSDHFIQRPVNINQFQHLENLFINGLALDLLNVIRFVTENARNFKNFKLEEKLNRTNADHFFDEISLPENVQHIEMGRKLEFSREGVKRLIERFVNLTYLSVYSDEDCSDLVQCYRNGNYDFTFINKKNNPLF